MYDVVTLAYMYSCRIPCVVSLTPRRAGVQVCSVSKCRRAAAASDAGNSAAGAIFLFQDKLRGASCDALDYHGNAASLEQADHCCGDEGYCCGAQPCGVGSDECGTRFRCDGVAVEGRRRAEAATRPPEPAPALPPAAPEPVRAKTHACCADRLNTAGRTTLEDRISIRPYDAFGEIGATFRKLEWKTPIFYCRVAPKTERAPQQG
jgi:hypothetical protein